MKKKSRVWHPNTQMKEWDSFDSIVKAEGMWLTDSKGDRMLDAVASMWCNVWGHSNPRLVGAIASQSRKIQHSSLFNLTHEPAETLAESLVKMSPGMHKVFYSDNGSSAMEVAIKIALQYWSNTDQEARTEIATLKNGYHGDTFGAMSVGYIPEFFGRFKRQLFPTIRFSVPDQYRMPGRYSTFAEYQQHCIDRIEKKLDADGGKIAAFVMESGAQVAGGVRIYPRGFQRKIKRICKKNGILLVLDEVATGFGRLGSMVQYEEQKSVPDIVAYGKMLTGGYLTMGATLTNKKIYDSYLGKFNDAKHLFHGHTYTANPIAAAVANENFKMYKKFDLIKRIQGTSKVFERFYDDLAQIDIVGDVRHKGMLMGVELVSNRQRKTAVRPADRSMNRIFYTEGKRHGIYLRVLGNIVMVVPPLAITEGELDQLLGRVVKTIKAARQQVL